MGDKSAVSRKKTNVVGLFLFTANAGVLSSHMT